MTYIQPVQSKHTSVISHFQFVAGLLFDLTVDFTLGLPPGHVTAELQLGK